jgi:hypothetical protein
MTDTPVGTRRKTARRSSPGVTAARCYVRTEQRKETHVCRNIKTLHNFEPEATDEEVYAAALQYVRKVSGSTKPSKANEAVFFRAVDEIAHITTHLLEDLVTTAPPRDREAEAEKARARAEKRFGAAA